MHKSLEEMVRELVQKANLSDQEINDLVKTSDELKAEGRLKSAVPFNVEAVLEHARALVQSETLPSNELPRVEALIRSIRAAKLIAHSPITVAPEEAADVRMERHQGKMSNGLNSVAHFDRNALNGLDEK